MVRAGAASFVLGAAAVAAALVALRPVTVVEIENSARGTRFHAPLEQGERFAVVYHHSMYDAPVTEEFVIEGDDIVLEAVSSPSAAVREYFGIVSAGERHAVRRVLPEIVFRVAAGEPQRLRLGRGERSFLELGDHGDRLVMRALRRPALTRWVNALAGGGAS